MNLRHIKHGFVGSSAKSIQLVQVDNGVDAAPAKGAVVSGDGSDDDTRVGQIDHAGHELADHEVMQQVVDLHHLLVSINGPLCVVQQRLVYARVAYEPIDGFGRLEFIDPLSKVAYGLKGVELAFHWHEAIQGKDINLGNGLHLVSIPDGANDMVIARLEERQKAALRPKPNDVPVMTTSSARSNKLNANKRQTR